MPSCRPVADVASATGTVALAGTTSAANSVGRSSMLPGAEIEGGIELVIVQRQAARVPASVLVSFLAFALSATMRSS